MSVSAEEKALLTARKTQEDEEAVKKTTEDLMQAIYRKIDRVCAACADDLDRPINTPEMWQITMAVSTDMLLRHTKTQERFTVLDALEVALKTLGDVYGISIEAFHVGTEPTH